MLYITNKHEEVYISSKVLSKIAFHSLLFSEPITEFRMVMGMLGSRFENENISIQKSICSAVGSSHEVSQDAISYADIAHFSQQLRKDNMFVVGWYCSMFPDGDFYYTPNMETQSRWQRMYDRSLVLVLYPQELIDGYYEEFITALRLKDLKSKDSSRDNWIELSIKMLDKDYNQFLQDLSSKQLELKNIISSGNKELISKHFREWDLFNFEEKNDILINLGLDLDFDEEIHSLYFTKEEFKILYYLTHADDPNYWDPQDLNTMKKIKKDVDDILNEILLTKREMRLIQVNMQNRHLERIPGFNDLNWDNKGKFVDITNSVRKKLREGYSKN